jgi:hypothetical protein
VTGSLRIVVLGYIVRGPLGGMAWHHLQYVLGFSRLGHVVHFVEDSDDYPSCYDPRRDVTDEDPSYGLAFAARAFTRLGLGDRWAYHDAHARRWFGPASDRAEAICRRADVVVNVSAVNPLRPWLADVPVRMLVDTDPVFLQLRHMNDPDARRLAESHTAFLTFGANGGLPDDGFDWQPTRQPVVLDAWPASTPPPAGRFTTVMQWQSYPVRVHAGVLYGMKAESFEPYVTLPERVGVELELALGSASAPRQRLRAHGWHVRDPRAPTRDPWAFQRYVARSRGEFSVAKHGYVASRCGWFSERTTSYLASCRPAVVQDTGFSDWLPTGRGVLAFSTPDEAAAALEQIESRYDEHCRAAYELVAEFFDARAVLGDLLAAAAQ